MSYPPRPPGMTGMNTMTPGPMPVPPYMTGPLMPAGMPPGGMMMGYPPMGHPSQMPGQMPGQMQPQMQPPQMQQPQMSQGPRTQNQMPPGSMQQSPTVISRGPRPANEGVGPSVTVFVGNITDRAPDNMMRQILQHCGAVVSWKRVQGASGVLQAFGFCEFSNPDAALRAIRLLHELEIGEKKLVVKVDAKTKLILDTYKADKIKSAGGGTSSGDDEFLTQEQRVQDKWVKERIGQTLKDYESEMQANQARAEEKERREQDKEKARAAKKEEANSVDLNKFETEIEEGKKDLITREIGKFREIAKKQDEEKEAERKKRKEKERERERRDRERDRERDRPSGRDRGGGDRDRDRMSERDRNRERDRRREKENENHRRSRTPPPRSRTPPGPPAQPSTPPRRSRSRDRTEIEARPPRRTEKDYLREKEEEEEALERKKAEKKAREKEVAYQERLRHWESRERKKLRDYDKLELKEKERVEEQQKQAVWLKQFLEDYDDERDDAKYYKGREMERRRAEREREIESDARDRQKEKEELEELKTKIFSEGHSDPTATLKQALYEREQQYKPQILVPAPPVSDAPRSFSPMDVSLPSQPSDVEDFPLMKEVNSTTPVSSAPSTPTGPEPKTISSSVASSVIAMEEDSMSTTNSLSPVPTESDSKQGSQGPSLVFNKRKKLEIKAVFNADEDDTDTTKKKRKLVPLDYGDELAKKEKEPKNTEEKRKNIKSLIEKIPTDKASLFAHPVEWSLVDNVIMERRIKPWVNKKIVEYIGEPEPTLVEFICSKVLIGSQPQNIINDVQMVLDEEAEVFVVKMWRLLIYELEAKKLGLMTK